MKTKQAHHKKRKRKSGDCIPGTRAKKSHHRVDDTDHTDADVLENININPDGTTRFPLIADCDIYPY